MNDKIMKYFGDAVCKLKTTQIKLKRKYKHYAAFFQNSCELKNNFQFKLSYNELSVFKNSRFLNHIRH